MAGVANAAGFATRPIAVPPQPALVGTQLWFQAAVPQALAATGVTLSTALRVIVGG